MMKIGLIDYYLDQYHAAYYPKWIKEVSGGEIQVTYGWAKIDSPNGKANTQCAEENGYLLLDSAEAVIEQSDGLIVMSPDHAEMHEELCRLPLASGKPTYVDKTFAPDRAAALRIIETAQAAGTPFFSTSAVRYASEYQSLPKENIRFINSRGPAQFDTYAIHQLEPIVSLMGSEIERIQFTGVSEGPAFALRFFDGRAAVFSLGGEGEADFSMMLSYRDAPTRTVTVASDFYRNFLTELVGFFRDCKPRVPAEDTLQIMTVLEYGKKAMQTPDIWVKLPNARV
jgi:predicted dehydrogenase